MDFLILLVWGLLGWYIVFKRHWCDQVISLEMLNVGGPWWLAFIATVCAVFLWPIGPITTLLCMKLAAKIKGVKVDED